MHKKWKNVFFRNILKVLKCGAGEVGPIVWGMKKCYKSRGGKEYQTYSKGKEDTLGWSRGA